MNSFRYFYVSWLFVCFSSQIELAVERKDISLAVHLHNRLYKTCDQLKQTCCEKMKISVKENCESWFKKLKTILLKLVFLCFKFYWLYPFFVLGFMTISFFCKHRLVVNFYFFVLCKFRGLIRTMSSKWNWQTNRGSIYPCDGFLYYLMFGSKASG